MLTVRKPVLILPILQRSETRTELGKAVVDADAARAMEKVLNPPPTPTIARDRIADT